MIRQVCYLSTAQHEFGDDTLADILAISRSNNMRDGLSGMLAYGRGVFFQVLEGPEKMLNLALLRIGKDPRHHRVQILQDEMLLRRDFESWLMAYRALGSGVAGLLDADGQIDPSAVPDLVSRIDNKLAATFLRRLAQAA